MSNVDLSAFVQRIFDAYGGKDAFFAASERRLHEYSSAWAQDSEAIGKVLRAHLAVEHFLGEYIATTNPNLGSIDDARISFGQKVALLGTSQAHIADLKPGLTLMNKIRNRIAYRLRADVTNEDKDAFLHIRLFAAMRSEKAKRFGEPPDDPVSVLEQFAHYAAGMLHAATDLGRDLWVSAMAAPQDSPRE